MFKTLIVNCAHKTERLVGVTVIVGVDDGVKPIVAVGDGVGVVVDVGVVVGVGQLETEQII